jgi:hypothetical protein
MAAPAWRLSVPRRGPFPPAALTPTLYSEMKRAAYLVFVAAASAWSSSFAARTEAASVKQADRATLATFAGTWVGHTRRLTITRTGRAREYADDGCCHRVIDFTFQLSRPRGTSRVARATATVTAVRVRDGSYLHVGKTWTLRLRDDVISEALIGTDYCGRHAKIPGLCGA